jgi:hypothetical protein
MGEWSLWILVGLSLVGWVFEALRYRRKMQSLENDKQQKRPLMSDEMLAVVIG